MKLAAKRPVEVAMLKRLVTPALVAAAAAVALVPLYGNPRTAPVTHAEWGRLLLRGLDCIEQ